MLFKVTCSDNHIIIIYGHLFRNFIFSLTHTLYFSLSLPFSLPYTTYSYFTNFPSYAHKFGLCLALHLCHSVSASLSIMHAVALLISQVAVHSSWYPMFLDSVTEFKYLDKFTLKWQRSFQVVLEWLKPSRISDFKWYLVVYHSSSHTNIPCGTSCPTFRNEQFI